MDLYFSGHVHDYERTFPVYNTTEIERGYFNPSHTVHIVSGNAGNDEVNVLPRHPEAPWSVTTNVGYGVGVLEVVNRTTVRWTALYSGHPADKVEPGTVMDEVYIVKEKYAQT